MSVGSLRYVFDSQDALLSFAMQAVVQRARLRIESRATAGCDAPERAIELLEQLLPLDDARRVEAQVWLAFTHRALIDPRLRAIRRAADDGRRAVCRTCLTELRDSGLVALDRDLRLETERLGALVDGLVSHVVCGRTAPRTARSVLRAHVVALGESS